MTKDGGIDEIDWQRAKEGGLGQQELLRAMMALSREAEQSHRQLRQRQAQMQMQRQAALQPLMRRPGV